MLSNLKAGDFTLEDVGLVEKLEVNSHHDGGAAEGSFKVAMSRTNN